MKVTQMSAVSPTPPIVKPVVQVTHTVPTTKSVPLPGNLGKILAGFDKDDYILLGLIAVLIFEGCDDYILLAALGYLFIMGINFQKN